MRKYYIAGNWKMHKTTKEAVELANALVEKLSGCDHKLMIAPPFTALDAVSKVVKNSNIHLAAQNMASEEAGAHTGEISPLMLNDLGVSVVILGHSERRAVYGETDKLINKKIKLALKHNLEVVFCIGETLQERESGKAEEVVKNQIKAGLQEISESDLKKITIAYEPVWAIGTGKTATPEDANAIHQVIRALIAELYSENSAENLIIQYGGSVKPANVADLMAMKDIDGALVGGASLSVENFSPIAEFNK